MKAVTPSTARDALIEARDLTKIYRTRSPMGLTTGEVRAVGGISFTVREGECYALVGESGCGKSTTGRLLQKLIEPTSGEITYRGKSLSAFSAGDERSFRADVQMIYQDPYSSLNPRKRVGSILAESMRIVGHRDRGAIRSTVLECLEAVGFSAEHAQRFPHEFSGGQRQRIGIARALTVDPGVLLCDEPVSALDVSIQAQILNLLRRLQRERGLSYLFISHDLSVVRHIADRVGVMYLGKIVEEGTTEEIFTDPQHPYTQTLLASVPARRPGGRRARTRLTGDVPSPLDLPSGCVFRTRCPEVMDRCSQETPRQLPLAGTHTVACHLHDDPALPGRTGPAGPTKGSR